MAKAAVGFSVSDPNLPEVWEFGGFRVLGFRVQSLGLRVSIGLYRA